MFDILLQASADFNRTDYVNERAIQIIWSFLNAQAVRGLRDFSTASLNHSIFRKYQAMYRIHGAMMTSYFSCKLGSVFVTLYLVNEQVGRGK